MPFFFFLCHFLTHLFSPNMLFYTGSETVTSRCYSTCSVEADNYLDFRRSTCSYFNSTCVPDQCTRYEDSTPEMLF